MLGNQIQQGKRSYLGKQQKEIIENVMYEALKDFILREQLDVEIFKNKNDQWEFKVIINLTRAIIGCYKVGLDLTLVAQEVRFELIRKLKHVALGLKKENFHMDETSEYDFYTQVVDSITEVPHKFKSIVLEDDPSAKKILVNALNSLGSDVDSFSFPEDALRSLDIRSYQLLILDWNLPFINGGDFLIEADKIMINKNQMITSIPTIVCSSDLIKSIDIPKVDCFELVDYWNKSMLFSSVISSMEKVIRQFSKKS
ncbi:MAG: response regulator [Bdellovibrionaceae bacterium]|nr:response regulator [Pseudobdellovibrionaceae bacterium]NUM59818.1 response regulator [Pseudobdellovibrionaceae bacterium]